MKKYLKKVVKSVINYPEYELGIYGSTMRKSIYHHELYNYWKDIDGDIVECGVGAGTSLSILLELVKSGSCKEKKIFAFDTFEGFPIFSDEDGTIVDRNKKNKTYVKYTETYITKNMMIFGHKKKFIDFNIKLMKGFIPDSFEVFEKNYNKSEFKISFLHLDLDIYQPYLDAFKYFYDSVTPGGIIAFDEYDSERDMKKWPGAKKAVDELQKEYEFKLLRTDLMPDKVYIIKE